MLNSLLPPTYDELLEEVTRLRSLVADGASIREESESPEGPFTRFDAGLFGLPSGKVPKEITHEIRREGELAVLRAIVETVPMALAFLRPDGTLCMANRSFAKVSSNRVAMTLDEWLEGVNELSVDTEALRHVMEASFESGDVFEPIGMTFVDDDAGRVHWLISFQCVPEQLGGAPATMLSGIDLTDELNLITRLSEAKSQMEDFLAAAAHDLKSPLITIAHNVAFAKVKLETAPDLALPHLDRVAAAERRMLELLQLLSTVSRAGRDPEPFERHSLRNIAEQAVSQIEGLVEERRATVTIDASLGEALCQGVQMQQVFVNLISNAIKYTPRDRTPVVAIERYQPEKIGVAGCLVRDNGEGIAPSNFNRIFGLFDRLTDKPDIPGHGVGLAIVRRIISAHDGEVWVESTPGEGAVFYFTLGKKAMETP